MSITIQEISGTRGLKKFAKFPIDLYKGNEYYVPSLVLDEVGTLDAKNNPATAKIPNIKNYSQA